MAYSVRNYLHFKIVETESEAYSLAIDYLTEAQNSTTDQSLWWSILNNAYSGLSKILTSKDSTTFQTTHWIKIV